MRIRTIKPEFFTHDGLFDAEKSEGLPLRVSFAGLWCAADREGRFKWEPRRLGAQILPYDMIDFSRVLDALNTRGFVWKYSIDGVEYGVIPSFGKHQVINNRERASEIPEPTPDSICDASSTRQPRVDHACKAEGKGKERKGTECLSVAGRDGYSDFIEKLWSEFPSISKTRSSKQKLSDAWDKTKPKPSEDLIFERIAKWKVCHEWTKESGQFAPGAHLWIKDKKWEFEPVEAIKANHNGFTPLFPGHNPNK